MINEHLLQVSFGIAGFILWYSVFCLVLDIGSEAPMEYYGLKRGLTIIIMSLYIITLAIVTGAYYEIVIFGGPIVLFISYIVIGRLLESQHRQKNAAKIRDPQDMETTKTNQK